MPTLSELQRELHELFRGQQSVGGTARAIGCDPERLAIYAGFVRDHVRTALDKNYPYLQRMLSAELWDRLCETYFASCPSREWEVNRAAEAWPSFLDQQRQLHAELSEVHVVLAQLEWEQFVTYMHPAPIPRRDQVEIVTLNPTVSVLELAYDLLEYIASVEADDTAGLSSLPAPEATVVLLYRDPVDHSTRAERATPELLFTLKMAAESIDVASAAQASGQTPARIRELLADAADRGLIILPAASG